MNPADIKADFSGHPGQTSAYSGPPKHAIVEPAICKFFRFEHLPERLQVISEPFCTIAYLMLRDTPPGAEQSAGLRKLLEAKDCFVRAALP